MEWIRDSPKKNHPAWPGVKKFCSTFDPTRARTHSGELTVWFRNNSLDLLPPGRQNSYCNIFVKSDIFLLKIVCASYNLFYYMNWRVAHIKKCMQQVLTPWKAVWTDLKGNCLHQHYDVTTRNRVLLKV